MKHFLFLSLSLFLCSIIAEAQTNKNIPGPENVLVVYNENSDTSEMIMEYYVNARGIPSSTNVLPLSLPRRVINLGDWSGDHVVKLGFDNQNIVDSTWAKWDSTHCVDTAKFNAYQYFIEEVANPIRTHLINNDLTETIRYIVMCQGVPYKIQAVGDWSSPGNLSVDGLLCMLNTDDYDDFVDTIFDNLVNDCYPGCFPPPYNCYSSPIISNPYLDEDSTFDFDSRFAPDYYTGSYSGYNYKLSYLVSRLDGLSFEIIKDIIDRSVDADKSGEGTWIIDNDLTHSFQNVDYSRTKIRLENFDFNFVYENTNTWVSHNTYNGNVMGYTSLGDHAEDGNCNFNNPTFIQDSLQFEYLNGAVLNTYESYNAYSINSLRRGGLESGPPGCSHTQGLITEFFLVGGTGSAGHSWEPYADYISQNYVYLPYYAMGYTQIDAAWQGMPKLAWRNVVIGDPLTAIAWGKQTLTEDVTMEGTNLVTGEIFISTDKILTIEDDSYIDLRHQGFITGHGVIVAGQNITFNVYDWKKALFLSYDSEHPRLIWGAHPDKEGTVFYNVMRKINQDNWTLVAQTTDLEYTDTEISLVGPLPVRPETFYKVLAYNEYPGLDTSNTVSTWTDKGQGKILAENIEGKKYSFTLEQNYPNPFNPATQIKYSTKEAGLIQLKIYDVLGRAVVTLVNENKEAGYYSVDFDASELPSGVYIYQLTTPGFTQARKMILAK